jgi:hypothetical protein
MQWMAAAMAVGIAQLAEFVAFVWRRDATGETGRRFLSEGTKLSADSGASQ